MRWLRRRNKMTSEESEASDAVGSPSLELAEEAPSTRLEDTPSPEAARRRVKRASFQIPWLPERQKVTVSIDQDAVRVVVSHGRKVLRWGTTLLKEPETEGESDSESQDQGLTWRLQTLLNELGVQQNRAVTDLPLHSTLIRQLKIPKTGRRFRSQIITSEVINTIPFSEEETDLAWQARRNGTGQEVLAIVFSKEAIDEHVQLLAETGIYPRAIYSKAMALAHAANVQDGIVTYIGLSHTAFVLVLQGMPQAVHHVELGDESTSPRERARSIAKAIEVVVGYAQSADSADSTDLLPVILAGQVPTEGPLVHELNEALQRDVLPLSPPIASPENFSPSEYAVNVGLILADEAARKSRKRASKDDLPSFNLLPERYLPKPMPLKQVSIIVGLLLLGALAVNIGAVVDSRSAEAADLQNELDTIRVRERQHQLTLANLNRTVKDVQISGLLVAGTAAHLADMKEGLSTVLCRLETLTLSDGALAQDTALTTVKQEGDGFALSGNGLTIGDVLLYMQNIQTSGNFSGVKLYQVSAAQTAHFQAKALNSTAQATKCIFPLE